MGTRLICVICITEMPKVVPRRNSSTGASQSQNKDSVEPAILKEEELDGTDSFFLAPAISKANAGMTQFNV